MECISQETRPVVGPNGEVGDWHCNVCLLTGADASNAQILAVLYTALETKNRPVAVYLCHMFKKMVSLEAEVAELRSQLQQRHTDDVDMTGNAANNQTPKRDKKVILFGKDVKKLEEPIKQRLPNPASFQTIPSRSNTDDETFFSEVKKVIEESSTSEILVCYHPSADDCLRLEGKKICSSLSSLSSWLADGGHKAVKLAVASVPQLVPDECQRINEQLEKAASEGHIEYIPMTRIQSTMLLDHSVVYSTDVATKVADVLSRSFTSFLGVKRKRSPKPEKKDVSTTRKPIPKSPQRDSKKPPANSINRNRKKDPPSSSRELQGLKSQLDVVLKCLQNFTPKQGQKRGGGRRGK